MKQQGHHVCEVPKPKRCRKTEDRLSSLPDEILIQIVSLVPTKTAMVTGILSSRWRNLWTQITSAVLEENLFDISHSEKHFLQRLISPTFNKVKLCFFRTIKNSLLIHHDIVRRICELKVRELHISCDDFFFKCPRSILRTSSLVSLHLGSRFYPISLSSDGIEFPKLLSLNMHLRFSSASGYSSLEKILRSCPILENLCVDLFVKDPPEPVVFHMYSTNLRLLNINGYRSRYQPLIRKPTVTVVVETPNLESFKFDTFTGVKCCFEAKPINLRNADLSMNLGYFEDSGILELYRSISDVRFLTLNITQLVVSSTTFPNLTHLTLMHLSWKSAMIFLIQCPNLRELILRTETSSANEKVNYGRPECIPPCMLTHVKRIEIEIDIWGSKKVELHYSLNPVKTLLSCASMLERLIITVVGSGRDYVRDMVTESGQLLFFEKVFGWVNCSPSKCQIEIYGISKYMGKEEKVWALKDGINLIISASNES